MECEACGALLDPDGSCFVCGGVLGLGPVVALEAAAVLEEVGDPEPAAAPEPRRRSVGRWFHPERGLRAYAVAHAVAAEGPLAWGADSQFWAYADGVWAPGDRVVHGRICRTLQDDYRPSHARAVRDVLRTELPEIGIDPAPLINVRTGMIDWREVKQIPHRPEYLSTVQLPIDWNDDATCPAFDEFLAAAVPPDDRMRVWEMLGYLMVSGNPLQRLFLLEGGGGNGKGVLLAVISALLGKANVSNVPLHEFAESQFAAAELFGKLANICGDIDSTFIEKTGRIKQMSGEDVLKGERKYGQPFYFEWWGKALFSANGIPGAADGSRGWLRRWEIIRFPNEPAAPDLGLKMRLTRPAELQGIAVRAVRALGPLLHRRAFLHGETAAQAHVEFAQRSNKLLAWIDDEAMLDPTAFYDRGVLLRAFRAWDNSQNPGTRAMSAATFYERLRQVKGMREVKLRGVRGFRGLRLNRDAVIIDLTDDDVPPEAGGSNGMQDTLWD